MAARPQTIDLPAVSPRLLRLTAAALIAGLLVAAVLTGMRLYERTRPVAPVTPPPLAVVVGGVEPQPFVRALRVTGSVEAERRVVLSAQLAARIAEIPFREGARVAEGEVLARLDDSEQRQELARLQAALDGVTADLAFWQAQLEADRRLSETQAISRRALDETQRRVTSLQAARREAREAVQSARTRLGYAVVRAPFDGYIQAVRILPGEFVPTGGALLEVLAAQPLKVILPVAENDLRELHEGQPVELHVPAASGAWPVRLARIFPALDRGTRSATIEVVLPEDAVGVRPGMAAVARVVLEEADQALVLPRQALRRQAGQAGVYIQADGVARWREVEPGPAQDGAVRILTGLAPGEQVILTPHPQLVDGRPVLARNDWSSQR